MGSFAATIAGRRKRLETTLSDDFAAVRMMNATYDSIYSGETIKL